MEVYLSRLYLNALNRDMRASIGDCHKMHRRIMAAFPDVNGGDSGRQVLSVLYRIETLEKSPDTLRLLVQSNTEPNWTALPRDWLQVREGESNPSFRPVSGVYGTVRTGMQLIFRLRANPTRRLGKRAAERGDRLVGKRVALLYEHDQMVWLERKGEQHGFRVLRTEVSSDVLAAQSTRQEVSRGWRRDDNNTAQRLSLAAVVFNGLIEVTDEACFRTALIQGIGSGKAFGFGLLSIAHPR